jgi:SAM-dependent methyltransferase
VSDFLASITTPEMVARQLELEATRPEIQVALYMLGQHRRPEWIHTIAAASDEVMQRHLPPLPPLALRSITWAKEEAIFLWTGAVDIVNLLALYERHAQVRAARPRTHDFGCGCGRLTRYLHLSSRYDASASDANPALASWCASSLPGVATSLNRLKPPLDLPAASVDIVYSVSVFTHLPLEAANAWLAELARITVPGGLIAITTHGYGALDIIAASPRHQQMFGLTAQDVAEIKLTLPDHGHIYLRYGHEALKMANLGDDYGNSFLDVRTGGLRGPGLQLIEQRPGGLRNWQDILLYRKNGIVVVSGTGPAIRVDGNRALIHTARDQPLHELVAHDPQSDPPPLAATAPPAPLHSPPARVGRSNTICPSILASSPASILNQKTSRVGNPLRHRITSSRSSYPEQKFLTL